MNLSLFGDTIYNNSQTCPGAKSGQERKIEKMKIRLKNGGQLEIQGTGFDYIFDGERWSTGLYNTQHAQDVHNAQLLKAAGANIEDYELATWKNRRCTSRTEKGHCAIYTAYTGVLSALDELGAVPVDNEPTTIYDHNPQACPEFPAGQKIKIKIRGGEKIEICGNSQNYIFGGYYWSTGTHPASRTQNVCNARLLRAEGAEIRAYELLAWTNGLDSGYPNHTARTGVLRALSELKAVPVDDKLAHVLGHDI